ncbi:MAG: ribosomal protein S18-alanine N-acetyltransferase [Lachnospiraceae bacterium]|nr:ribosomal protein S18-alanine N-acetyltransferase [Lachnospiraceae bacterium]
MTREKTAGKEQTFRVRAASPEDLPVLSKIEKACFSDPWSVVLIRECLDNPSLYRLYAAEDEEGVFGYSVMSLVLDEAGIDNLAVLPGHRRSGAGSALLSQMLSDARMLSAESAVLEVRESNTPAIALYERFGFQQVGFRKNYYENPTEGAKLYSLRLS